MEISTEQIAVILENYNIGSLVKFEAKLESGFQSDNFHIQTEQGHFVVRQIHDSENSIEYSMTVYEYLATHGIKTPRPERTKENKLFLLLKGKIFVIQTFLEGNSRFTEEETFEMLPFFGRELGRVHSASKKMVEELGEENLTREETTIDYVRGAVKKYMPDNAYIQGQYHEWEVEIELLPDNLLSKGVIHGDVGPKDFFFNEGEYSGIIDFNAAGLDYLLFDIAPMMMYCGMYHPTRLTHYVRFVKAYLEESPVRKEEFKWLNPILRTRWLVQILYHQYRYVEGITQGSETGKVEENLEGVRDGENFLKWLEKCSKYHYYDVLG